MFLRLFFVFVLLVLWFCLGVLGCCVVGVLFLWLVFFVLVWVFWGFCFVGE